MNEKQKALSAKVKELQMTVECVEEWIQTKQISAINEFADKEGWTAEELVQWFVECYKPQFKRIGNWRGTV